MFNRKEKQAVMNLFEELYDSANEINPQAIHDAMKTILRAYDLEEFMEMLDPNMLNVVHYKRLDEANLEINKLENK